MPLSQAVPPIARELALRLREGTATYAAMAYDEVVDAGELLLLGIIRAARSGDPGRLDAHVRRLGALRADQLVSQADVEAAFVEVRAALRSAVAALSPDEAALEPDLATLLDVSADAEQKLIELLRSPR